MVNDAAVDYYELLQVSPNADPDLIHRIYRLLAQRVHPDNRETGDPEQFRQLHEAYAVLSDPEKRARYDVLHLRQRQDRWRMVELGSETHSVIEMERSLRLTVLEVLYTRRRTTPNDPGLFDLDLAALVGRTRDDLEFGLWYLISRGLVRRADGSRLTITAEGVDYLEEHHPAVSERRRLPRPQAA
jgi:curved DNA-binding protein CbpA